MGKLASAGPPSVSARLMQHLFPMEERRDLDPDELSQIASYGPDIYNYCDQMEASFITGATPIDSGWDNYVSTLQKMNLQALVDVYQKAYERFNSN